MAKGVCGLRPTGVLIVLAELVGSVRAYVECRCGGMLGGCNVRKVGCLEGLRFVDVFR